MAYNRVASKNTILVMKCMENKGTSINTTELVNQTRLLRTQITSILHRLIKNNYVKQISVTQKRVAYVLTAEGHCYSVRGYKGQVKLHTKYYCVDIPLILKILRPRVGEIYC